MMPERLAHNPDNYLYGKGRLYFKKENSGGYLDLGNIPEFTITPEVTSAEHYSSRSGTKKKDLSVVQESKMSSEFKMEEYSSENLNIAFLGGDILESSQAVGNISGTAVTVQKDLFVDLDKMNLSSVKLTHGIVTAGPFAKGDTITGATSHATGTVGWVGSGFIELYNVSGTFAVETVSSGGKSAAVSSAEVMEDIIVVDNASSPTKRYTAGTDYDVDINAGLLRASSDGTITTTAYIFCDYALIEKETIKALTNTSCSGQLLFIGDPDTGPKWRIDIWTAELTVSSAVGFISDDITPISMKMDILADETNHPSEPFFRAVRIG